VLGCDLGLSQSLEGFRRAVEDAILVVTERFAQIVFRVPWC
jgi:hypothetical protein